MSSSHAVPTPDGHDIAKKDDSPVATQAAPAPRRSCFLRCTSFFGLLSLGYLLGAAVIFFELPTSSFLRRAFVGGAAWYEAKKSAPPDARALPRTSGKIDKPDKTADGFTLCMCGTGSRAFLIDMHGKVAHQWQVPFNKLWSDPPHLRGPIQDETVYFNDGHIYPNGDLLVVIEGPIDVRNSSNGYGLARLDKDSNVLWKYAEKCHHDLDVGEDGTIYALTNEVLDSVPSGLDGIPTPCMVDEVHVLSPEGKPLKKIALLEALHRSPYRPLLGPLERGRARRHEQPGRAEGHRLSPFGSDVRNRDVLHTNSVKVLSRKLAAKFPLFEEGQLLVSLRNIDVIAVLDPNTEKVVWAARGPWLAQHDPSFLDNGHLLLFDNLGSPRGSRVLEYDPRTQDFPWSYPDENARPFLSRIRGMCQRLINGNTLIVNSDGSEVFEVTPDKEVVWSCSFGGVELNRARRYMPGDLPFLKGAPRARP